MDPEGTEHHLLLDADFPDLLAEAVQEEKLHGVLNGLILESGQFLSQRQKRSTHRPGTVLFAVNIPGDPLEFPGAHSVEEQTAQGGVHAPAPVFVTVENAEFRASLVSTDNTNLIDDAESGQKIPQIMTVAIGLAPGSTLVAGRPELLC